MTTIPTITALPTPPSTDDPANFSTRADAFLGALQSPFVTEANAMAGAMNTVAGEVATNASAAATSASDAETASDAAQAAVGAAVAATTYVATSSTSLAVSAGAKAITLVESGRTFANNDDITLFRRGDNRVRMRGVASSCDMVAKTLTVTIPAGGFSGSGTYTDWIVSHSAFTNLPGGKQSIPIPVAAMIARTTNGPQMGLAETTTNKVMRRSLEFDASTIEYAQFSIAMPKSWNEGTISFEPIWAHPATTTNFKVSWGLQAVALSDADALDAAFGTAQYSNDTGGATDTVYIGPESAAITVAGTPQAGDLVVFQVLRKADDGTNDTLAVDARLLGLRLYITTDAADDA